MSGWPYNTANWKRLRLAHLARFPFCEDHLAVDRIVAANTVDHRLPISEGGHPFPSHDGLASYCASCHSAKTARGPEAGAVKSRKPRKGCSADGSPLDPRHPWNDSGTMAGTDILARPDGLRPSLSPLIIVFGPPGAGKSRYVSRRTTPLDQVLDLDAIIARQTGQPLYQDTTNAVAPALRYRNAQLRKLANVRTVPTTWLIVSASTGNERDWWRAQLQPVASILIMPPMDVAMDRIAKDTRRGQALPRSMEACRLWYERFTPSRDDCTGAQVDTFLQRKQSDGQNVSPIETGDAKIAQNWASNTNGDVKKIVNFDIELGKVAPKETALSGRFVSPCETGCWPWD